MFFSVIQYMNLPKAIRDLCTPAQVYLGISVIAFIVILIQNFGNKNSRYISKYKYKHLVGYLIMILKDETRLLSY